MTEEESEVDISDKDYKGLKIFNNQDATVQKKVHGYPRRSSTDGIEVWSGQWQQGLFIMKLSLKWIFLLPSLWCFCNVYSQQLKYIHNIIMREKNLTGDQLFWYSLPHTPAHWLVSHSKSGWRWIGVISLLIIGNYIDVCSL